MPKTDKKACYPFPEIGDEDRALGWKIHPGSGATALSSNPEGRELFIPLGRSEHARGIRFHELLHKEWSPWGDSEEVKAVKAHPMTVNCVEDFRITEKAVRAGLGDRLRLCKPEYLPGMTRMNTSHEGDVPVKELTLRLVSVCSQLEMRDAILTNLEEAVYEAWDSGLEKRAKQLEGVYQIIETVTDWTA